MYLPTVVNVGDLAPNLEVFWVHQMIYEILGESTRYEDFQPDRLSKQLDKLCKWRDGIFKWQNRLCEHQNRQSR